MTVRIPIRSNSSSSDRSWSSLSSHSNIVEMGYPVEDTHTRRAALLRERLNPTYSNSPSKFNASSFNPATYTNPFIDFISNNPTTFHAVTWVTKRLKSHGFVPLLEREEWDLKAGGKYFFERNGSGVIAFTIGENFKAGNGAAIIAAHIDALTSKVKPVSTKPNKNGFIQLGVAQYAGALSQTWMDRDLSIGGRVFVKSSDGKHIDEKLVRLPYPVAKIPSIAPHFGLPSEGQLNQETRMAPIIGLDNSDFRVKATSDVNVNQVSHFKTFAESQPPALFKAISGELSIQDSSSIVNWELEVFDSQPAQRIGLAGEFISAGRIDDKACSFAAIEALLLTSPSNSGLIKVAACFDDEEVGSLLRQGANSNFLTSMIERINETFCTSKKPTECLLRTYANSFLLSADVTHAYNPNYDDVYLAEHAPRLNIGVGISFDSNAHMTTDGHSSTIMGVIAEKCECTLQPFQIRNDSRSGGTVGPMLSAKTGIRAAEIGIPQLSMHSIRATTGALDIGLGVKFFAGFLDEFESANLVMSTRH